MKRTLLILVAALLIMAVAFALTSDWTSCVTYTDYQYYGIEPGQYITTEKCRDTTRPGWAWIFSLMEK